MPLISQHNLIYLVIHIPLYQYGTEYKRQVLYNAYFPSSSRLGQWSDVINSKLHKHENQAINTYKSIHSSNVTCTEIYWVADE